MDIRTRKTKFLESLDSTEVIRKAVSLAIDCIIDNHNSNEDIPLVITSYDDLCRIQVLNYVQEFCEAAFLIWMNITLVLTYFASTARLVKKLVLT